MPEHWVYLLKCENNRYYVGETIRLKTRLSEHCGESDNKSKFCYNYPPKYLFGFYKARYNEIYKDYSKILNNNINENDEEFEDDLHSIMQYYPNFNERFYRHHYKSSALELENEITLLKMKSLGRKWYRVRGGKYNKNYIEFNPSTDFKPTRPLCNCITRIPAEIKVNDNNLYFRCVKKSMGWFEMDEFENEIYAPFIDEPCDFYLKVDKNNNYFKNNFNNYYPEYRDVDFTKLLF